MSKETTNANVLDNRRTQRRRQNYLCIGILTLIAAGLSPLAPEQHLLAASRLFLRELEDCIAARQDFAFETTLSGRSYLKLLERLQATGWQVELIYLALPSADMSRLRVAERVSHGGHHIAEADLIRRFPRSLHNLLNVFAPKVNQVRCFMNNDEKPELIFQQTGIIRTIVHTDFFTLLQKEAQL